MNNKGQALVEFVLILPIFLFILLTIYDFGRIFNEKNSLEGKSSDVIDMYKSGKSLDEIENIYEDISITITSDNEYDKIIVESSLEIITPGLGRIFGKPYIIKVERYIPNA